MRLTMQSMLLCPRADLYDRDGGRDPGGDGLGDYKDRSWDVERDMFAGRYLALCICECPPVKGGLS